MAKVTNCSKCGKQMTYKTKKPKTCTKCRKNVQYNYNKESSRSKLEFKVQSWLDELFPEPKYHYIANGYYSWIRSPKGYPLQLDFFIYSNHKPLFAIEVQGSQHYKKSHFQTQKEFDYLMDCDIIKSREVKKKGIPLITLPYLDEMNKESFIKILKDNKIKDI